MVAQLSWEPGIESSERYTSESIRLIHLSSEIHDVVGHCDHSSSLRWSGPPTQTHVRIPLAIAMAGEFQLVLLWTSSGAVHRVSEFVFMSAGRRVLSRKITYARPLKLVASIPPQKDPSTLGGNCEWRQHPASPLDSRS